MDDSLVSVVEREVLGGTVSSAPASSRAESISSKILKFVPRPSPQRSRPELNVGTPKHGVQPRSTVRFCVPLKRDKLIQRKVRVHTMKQDVITTGGSEAILTKAIELYDAQLEAKRLELTALQDQIKAMEAQREQLKTMAASDVVGAASLNGHGHKRAASSIVECHGCERKLHARGLGRHLLACPEVQKLHRGAKKVRAA